MMVRQARSVANTALERTFDPDEAKRFFAKAKRDWETRHDTDLTNVMIYEHTGINDSTVGQIFRGKKRALVRQCLPLAHELEVPVEVVLRVEGYPDVAGLLHLFTEDPMLATKRSYAYILEVLTFAAQSKEWQALDWQQVDYKERADNYLASDYEVYEKAKYYADEVYGWWKNRGQIVPRERRKTSEMAIMP